MNNIKRLQQLAGIDETKIGPKPPEYHVNKFIDDNYDIFSGLEENEIEEYKIGELDKKIVDFVKKIYDEHDMGKFHVYRGIAIYYVPAGEGVEIGRDGIDEVWVENMDINETKISPKPNIEYTQLKPIIDDYLEDYDIYDRESFDELNTYIIDDIAYELAYLRGSKYNSFDDFTKDEDSYKKYNNLATQYLHKYGYEKFNIDETKIAPKTLYYAIINYGYNNTIEEPAYYITAGTKPEMINKLNMAIEKLMPRTGFRYIISDMDKEGRNTYIYDDWAIVTANKDYFEDIMKDYPTRPKQSQTK